MSKKHQSADKVRLYLESYFKFGFNGGQDRTWPECVICGETTISLLMKQSCGTVPASLCTEFTRHMNMLREEIKPRLANGLPRKNGWEPLP